MRKEWVNYTTPAGGPFTSFNIRSMVFMYDEDFGATTTGGGLDIWLLVGVGAGALIVGVVITYFITRRK
jgi:hypothetical protein